MANIIKPKRSNTAAKVPNTSELLSGELGVNMADRKIYINNGTSVVQVGAGLLSALGDVVITTPSSGQSLSYNGTNWVNSSAGAGTVTSVGITPLTGVTVSNSPITTSGNITVGLSTKLTAIENLAGAGFFTQNGSGVIAGRTIQAGTGISVAHGNGASQDPTISNSGVLGVTATSPVASSGGQNPVISIPAATTSVSGYLTSTDWNTFNGKQAALVSGTNIKTVNGTTLLGSGNLAVGTVTSVGATVPTGLTVSGSPITTSGTLAITYTAGYAIPTTAKQTEWDSAYTYRVPSGGIIIWSGAQAAIPSGWLLCNGLNGTPDLRDRFVVGAGSTYAVGATGGSANATLVSHTHTATSTFTGSALATHNHTASFSGTSVTPAGSVSSSFTGTSVTPAGSVSSTFTGSALATHNHTASFTGSALGTHTHTATSTVTDPGHFHNLPGNTSSGSIRQTQIGVNSTAVNATSSTVATGITVGTAIVAASAGTPAGSVTNTAISAGTPAGSVSSSFTGTAFTPAGSVSSSFTGTAFTPAGSVTNTAISAGTPAGSVSTTNSTEGSSATNANLPPYYALCYIMKS